MCHGGWEAPRSTVVCHAGPTGVAQGPAPSRCNPVTPLAQERRNLSVFEPGPARANTAGMQRHAAGPRTRQKPHRFAIQLNLAGSPQMPVSTPSCCCPPCYPRLSRARHCLSRCGDTPPAAAVPVQNLLRRQWNGSRAGSEAGRLGDSAVVQGQVMARALIHHQPVRLH
jgi:hypothetical protein